jgi:branched-chain amino acid aminotransferase
MPDFIQANTNGRLHSAHEASLTPLNPAWITGNYLNNILGLREARAPGADEAVMTNHAGEIAEAAVSNIGLVQGANEIALLLRAAPLSAHA